MHKTSKQTQSMCLSSPVHFSTFLDSIPHKKNLKNADLFTLSILPQPNYVIYAKCIDNRPEKSLKRFKARSNDFLISALRDGKCEVMHVVFQ